MNDTEFLDITIDEQALAEVTQISKELGISSPEVVSYAIRILSDAINGGIITSDKTKGKPSDTRAYKDSWIPAFRLAYVIAYFVDKKLDMIKKITIETDKEKHIIDWEKD